MSRVTPFARRLAAAVVLLVPLATRGAAAPENPGGAQATCVFTNPAYSGKCTQTVAVPSGGTAAQACQVVLECLNNAQCSKTYCDATQVRGGWKLESAK